MPERTKVFYKIWTAKEAFVKAIGMGFSFPLKNISVTLNHEYEISIKSIEGFHIKTTDWKTYNFIPCDNYTCTLIVNTNAFHIKTYSWGEFLNSTNSVLD